jgi:transmembrane protein 216
MAVGEAGRPTVRSSLPFQMLMFFNSWYFVLFFFLELALFTYKGLTFPYPGGALAAEIILIFILAGLETVRIFLGYKGNLIESIPITVTSLIFTIVSFFGVLYLLIWQTYVLRADVILTAIEIAFIGLEFILAIICVILFAR